MGVSVGVRMGVGVWVGVSVGVGVGVVVRVGVGVAEGKIGARKVTRLTSAIATRATMINAPAVTLEWDSILYGARTVL